MDTSSRQFGLVVAYVLPGFIGLGGIALLVPPVAQWLQPAITQGGANLSAPVYALLAATALGMILSCFRWILIDHLHQLMGVALPMWDIDRLEERLGAFNQLVEYHYRYYQFYANTLVAILWTYSLNRWIGTSSLLGPGTDLGVVILCAALFAGSRDALAKYYARTSRLIGQVAEKDATGDFMTNGCHHDQAGGAPSAKRPVAKPETKNQAPKSEPAKDQKASSNK